MPDNTIETLQKENEQLRTRLNEWKYETKCHIDEVMARENYIKQLQTQITQVREALQKMKKIINAWDKATWFECTRCGSIRDALTTITKIIGGAENGSSKDK